MKRRVGRSRRDSTVRGLLPSDTSFNMTHDLHRTDVVQAFRDHEILITGANGFLGKVLLGLILDRFRDFKHLHIVLRPEGNLSAEERFYCQTLASPALEGITKTIAGAHGNQFLREKITVWAGDVSKRHCGMSAATVESLAGRIGAVINCAGLVEFLPPIDEAFSSNVDGVSNVVALAKQLGARLLHVSTCYVCGQADGLIEETEPILGYYPHRRGPEDKSFDHIAEIQYCRERIRQICESGAGGSGVQGNTARGSAGVSAEARLDAERAELRGGRSKEAAQRLVALGRQRAEHWGWVNTYTYSKSLGEQIIAAEPGLEYAIVRPAIVESALRFPFPGWVEGGRTSAPLVLMALGGLKDWPVRYDIPLEVVPVDLVASAILVVTALLLDGRQSPVYQLGSADVNPLELGPLVKLLHAESQSRSRQNGNGRNANHRSNPGLIERLVGAGSAGRRGRLRFLSEDETRARFARLQKRANKAQDFIARTGRLLEKSRLPGKQRLAGWSTALRTLGLQAGFRQETLDQYLPFVLHNRYIFESQNIRTAYSLISETDRALVPWDPEQIDWEDYWINHQVKGIEAWVQPEAVKEWSFRI